MNGEPIGGIVQGHALLCFCALLYLAWWAIFFRPDASVHGALYAVGVVCILAAAVCGIAGAARIVIATAALPAGGIPGVAFLASGVVAYIVLALVTNGLFARPITTELLLICAWCALELYALSALASAAALPTPAAIALVLLVVVLTACCLVCYVLYYGLPPLASFVDGMAPLIAVGAEALVMVVVLKGAGA